jgi:hypothetical protein
LNGFGGFIENEANLYTIDFEKKQIKIRDKSISIEDHIIDEFGTKYIAAAIISEAFGLKLTFNSRSVSAKLTSSFELNLIKQLRIEKNRRDISKTQGMSDIIIDTVIPRDYHIFKFGTLDWGLNSSQNRNSNNSSINIGIGTELLFGEANFSINYNPQNKFDINQLAYSWRWVNNDKKIIKQAQIGQVSAQSISNLQGPLIGATINNSSNTIQKASGYYTISDITEPNWTVELYINDVLIDYTLADPAGLYQFKVPIVYGYITTKLKFYGPLGEERTEERVMNTPYTFTAAKTFQYNLTTGIVQDTLKSRFARADFNYGITRNLTVNTGLEYLSSNPNSLFNTFAKVAFLPYPNVLLNLDFTPNKTFNSLVDYIITKKAFLQIKYTKFLEEQTSATDELSIKFLTPLKAGTFSGFTTTKYTRYSYGSVAFNRIDFSVASRYKQLKINSSSSMNWTNGGILQINSALLLSKRISNKLRLRLSTNYNVTSNELGNITTSLQIRVLKMNILVNYIQSLQNNSNSFSISTQYDLPFSRLGFSSSYQDNNFNFSESAQGSLTFGEGFENIKSNKNSAIGKGGILLHPFIDLNGNDILDNGEKRVLLSSVNISNASAKISKKDSIVRVLDLNAFVNYTVEFSDTDLNYVSWRFKNKNYQIHVDPNQYKHVYVPIITVGEASGMVYLKSGKTIKGQRGVRIQIYDEKGIKVAETRSEFDGYFSYLGLQAGKYSVRVDQAQLKSLNYQALPTAHQLTIKTSKYGDIIDDLDFTLSEKAPITSKEKPK